MVNRCNFPSGANQFGTFFANVILKETAEALNRYEIACQTLSGRVVLHPNQLLPGIVIMIPTTQYVRALREEIIFETEEDCIVVSCRKLNPRRYMTNSCG